MRDLLGERVTEVHATRGSVAVTAFGTPEELHDYFKANYGPTITVYAQLDSERAAELDGDLADLGRRFAAADGAMARDYLLLTAGMA